MTAREGRRRSRRSRSDRRSERGSLALIPVLTVVAFVLLAAVAQLGEVVVLRARADAAADAAALAAADQLALGVGNEAAARAALVTASENGALLVTCACEGRHAEVVVEIDTGALAAAVVGGSVRGRARAEVLADFDRSGARLDRAPVDDR